MGTDVAAATLIDEHRTGDGDRVHVEASRDAQERIQTYLVRAGSVRRNSETAWAFGRRQLDASYCLVEFGGAEEKAVLCLLPDEGILLVDRGGPALENEFVAAFLGGYFDHHDGDFELHAQPLTADDVNPACLALANAGLTTDEGDGRGPFSDALGRIAANLASRPSVTDS